MTQPKPTQAARFLDLLSEMNVSFTCKTQPSTFLVVSVPDYQSNLHADFEFDQNGAACGFTILPREETDAGA